mgnify:FL=1
MFPLLKLLNKDLVKEIYFYNNYSKLDMEWFKYLHKERNENVMLELYYRLEYPKFENWKNIVKEL